MGKERKKFMPFGVIKGALGTHRQPEVASEHSYSPALSFLPAWEASE